MPSRRASGATRARAATSTSSSSGRRRRGGTGSRRGPSLIKFVWSLLVCQNERKSVGHKPDTRHFGPSRGATQSESRGDWAPFLRVPEPPNSRPVPIRTTIDLHSISWVIAFF